MFLLLTLNYFTTFSRVSIVGFEQVNVSWVLCDFFSRINYFLQKNKFSMEDVFKVNVKTSTETMDLFSFAVEIKRKIPCCDYQFGVD